MRKLYKPYYNYKPDVLFIIWWRVQ